MTDKETNKPRGYAFIEYMHTRDMKSKASGLAYLLYTVQFGVITDEVLSYIFSANMCSRRCLQASRWEKSGQ